MLLSAHVLGDIHVPTSCAKPHASVADRIRRREGGIAIVDVDLADVLDLRRGVEAAKPPGVHVSTP